MLAFVRAKGGFDVPADLIKSQAVHITDYFDLNRDRFKDGRGTPGGLDTAGYALFALELTGHKPDENTAAVVEYLLKGQADRDHWRTLSNRPPIEASDFPTTYFALAGLRVWGPAAKLDKENCAQTPGDHPRVAREDRGQG